ncbi:uncharacterized protein LOC123554492 isoform X3 [Mercenaria mercenaria]|uniref:uncharacterized protein LOC123554492 isoform X3 n=1 Tax=Mercenaria mercenaria TaxID=6596 RepID=UPI00234EF5FD|nr:uncharacterized protein LOC123554492 isoform X3 [Mercenaria mercenaria]
MAFLGGYSEDFDLDDDGILRDSVESGGHWMDCIIDNKTGGILIDDDGIVRDDFDILSKHGSSTHWTDSGLGGDKQSSTPSTLRQLDLQSYDFEDVSRNFDESNINISDLEASKDDLSFDNDFGDTEDRSRGRITPKGNRSGLSSRSSFDHSLNYDETFDGDDQKGDNQKQDLFGEEYYRQLQELGVLVDEDDFANPRDSLQEFENLETHYSRDYDGDGAARDEIEEFLRQDGPDATRESMDIELPDQGVRNSERKLYESHGFDSFDQRQFEINEGKRTRPNTASSTRTISSRSFPEISPEEALELYTERIQSLDHDNDSIRFEQSQSQRTDQSDDDEENDDEIFFVTSQENDGDSPKPAKMPAYDIENKPSLTPQRKNKKQSGQLSDDSRSVTPQGHSQDYDDESDRSRSVTPQAKELNQDNNGYQSNDERFDSLTQVTRLDSRNKTQSESDTFRPDSALSELSSAASESRSVRPKTSKSQGKPPMQQKGGMSHARSQESFFDHETGSFKKLEKGPKRLLPKPSPIEENQPLKVKSKSATNLNAMGPVKPTHMTLSEIRNINIDDPIIDLQDIDKSEPKSNASDVPKGELTQKLKQESNKRQQATQLVRQLQSDYDKLLSKYALAELTIDQMRLGAKISIHANSPTPSQATSGSLQSAQHLHMLQLAGGHRGSLTSASPSVATPNVFFPESQPQDGSESRMPQHRGTSPALLPRSDSTNSMDSTSTPRGDVEEPGGIANDAEKVKLGLMFQTRNLDERMQSFQTLLANDENQLTVEEQESVFDKIRTDHEKLRRDYLQSKEDYNVLRRSTATGLDVAFDQEKELEGELFKLGMKFDEIHEKVEENLKEKSAKRQPFQKKHQESGDSTLENSMDVDPSTENIKKKMEGISAGNDLLEPKRDSEFDKKLEHLHEEYNALMDRYRRLKQMAKTPEREKEIDNLVKKLRKICKEEPDIFKLPSDLQPGYDTPSSQKAIKSETVHTQQTLGTRPKSSENFDTSESIKPPSPEKRKLPQPKLDKSPAKSYEILTASETWSLAESIDRWAQSKEAHEERRRMSKSQDNLNSSMASNRSYRSEDRDGDSRYDDLDSGLQNKHRSGSYSSLSSRGRHTPDFSSHDRGSPVPSLPRPQRHDYPDRERRDRRELKKSVESLRASTTSLATDSGIDSVHTPKSRMKKPEGGSTTSLQDSGISEHEGGATGGHSGPSSPLSKLPGPGKFKQMTGRRELDTDSGFIGSMVGSEVSAGNLSSRRQPPQSPLRLRHPGEMPNQRPSSRQSNRSEDSARATTPRSARSVASSRSSRRTPTKAFPLPETKQTENEARAKTPSKEERKTPSRSDSRTKTREQQLQTSGRSRDFTDDSYTSVTESEMSFDSDMRGQRHRPSSRNTSQRNIEKIMEDSEEEQYSIDPTLNETTDLNLSWITSDSERPSIKQSKRQDSTKQTPKKAQETSKSGSKVTPQGGRGQTTQLGKGQAQARGRDGRRFGEMTDESTTSTMSTRDITQDLTQDTTQDSYTSDETTPRSVIERERKQAKLKQQSRPNQETKTKRAPSPATEVAPPQRVTTPLKASRSEVHPKKILDSTLDSSPEPPRIERQAALKPKYVDRSIGSGSEETILASDAETAATGATRGSANSARIKLLSDEIGKLREEFVRANNERANQQQVLPPPPALPQQQQNQYYDQYFDPTEDPLAFMRGPRRRANSFSGHGGRDWDYDWTLPNVNRDGDIPLGYAAADAYASPRHKQKHEESPAEESRTRGRNRLRRRIHQRNSGTQHYPEQNGYESDQSPTRAQAEEVQTSPSKVQGHYGYYTPQQNTASPAQQNIQVRSPGQLQPGRRVFGSQPNLAYTGYQPPPPPRSTASGSTRSASQTSSTRPLRQTLYSYAANPTQNRAGYNQSEIKPPPYGHHRQRQYASDDICLNDGQTQFIPNGATDIQNVQNEGGIYTSSCPICGSSSYHSHGDFVYPPEDHRVPLGYIVHDGRQIVDSVQVPIYSLPPNVATPTPRPFSSRSFRSPLPFRIYKAPPQLKPHLLPINIPKKIIIPQVTFQSPPPARNQPMAASHDAVHQPIIEMDSPAEEGAQPRTRARSKSWGRSGRIRHYSPDGRIRSRYFVREFGNDESDSAESEEEVAPRRRSRSVGRRRLRHGRKYRRVRGEEEYESDRGSGSLNLKKSKSQPNVQEPAEELKGGNHSPEEKISAAGEDDLNRSLRLVSEIDELTHKMMDTVSGELAVMRRGKEFGSSVW